MLVVESEKVRQGREGNQQRCPLRPVTTVSNWSLIPQGNLGNNIVHASQNSATEEKGLRCL